MADAAGAAVAGTKFLLELGNFFLKLYRYHETWTTITQAIQGRKEEVFRQILNLRGHRGISTSLLHSQTAVLIDALRYSKWPGDLGAARLANEKLPDDNTALLDRIAYLVSEIHPPYHDNLTRNGRDSLPLKSRIAIQFTVERWMAVIGILANVKQALEYEVEAAKKRFAFGTTIRTGLLSIKPSEDPGALILRRAGFAPKDYENAVGDQISVLEVKPHERQFLFVGVAGSGKSTVAIALRNYLEETGSRRVILIHTHLPRLSTLHDTFTHMAHQLITNLDPHVIHTTTVSQETLQLSKTSPPSPPYSIPFLKNMISDCLVDAAVDLIVDEVSECPSDELYQFCQHMLKRHPRLRLLWFRRENETKLPGQPSSVATSQIIPTDKAVEWIFHQSVSVNADLAKYQSGILTFLKTCCGDSYRIMYAVLFKLCCTSSCLEIERYLTTPEFCRECPRETRQRLATLANSSLLDLIVLVLVSLEQSVPKTLVLRLAIDVHNYWPNATQKPACSLSDVPSTEFREQIRLTTTNLDDFLVDNNEHFGLKDPRLVGFILAFMSTKYHQFATLFAKAFVNRGYLKTRYCTELAQQVALVFPDSCNHFQNFVTGSADFDAILKESVPAAYDSDCLQYMLSLAGKKPQYSRASYSRFLGEAVSDGGSTAVGLIKGTSG